MSRTDRKKGHGETPSSSLDSLGVCVWRSSNCDNADASSGSHQGSLSSAARQQAAWRPDSVSIDFAEFWPHFQNGRNRWLVPWTDSQSVWKWGCLGHVHAVLFVVEELGGWRHCKRFLERELPTVCSCEPFLNRATYFAQNARSCSSGWSGLVSVDKSHLAG